MTTPNSREAKDGYEYRRSRATIMRIRLELDHAWRWLRHSRPGRRLLELVVDPLRRGRLEPRVRKRCPKEFPRMNHPRKDLRHHNELPLFSLPFGV